MRTPACITLSPKGFAEIRRLQRSFGITRWVITRSGDFAWGWERPTVRLDFQTIDPDNFAEAFTVTDDRGAPAHNVWD